VGRDPAVTAHDSRCKVIVLTAADSDQVVREALDAGASGFVLNAGRGLLSAVEALQRNQAVPSALEGHCGKRRAAATCAYFFGYVILVVIIFPSKANGAWSK
jgi:DNA-binding NarL/FixJ family response regulator